MLGTRTAQTVREAATSVGELTRDLDGNLRNLRGDAEDALREVRTAAQGATIAFAVVAVVAVVALLLASAALVRVSGPVPR